MRIRADKLQPGDEMTLSDGTIDVVEHVYNDHEGIWIDSTWDCGYVDHNRMIEVVER